MSDQSNKMIEKPDAAQTDSSKPLSSKGIDAFQGELQAYQDDMEKYEEQLFKHKARMHEIGNPQAENKTEAEIRERQKQLNGIVQKKYRIKPDPSESTGK